MQSERTLVAAARAAKSGEQAKCKKRNWGDTPLAPFWTAGAVHHKPSLRPVPLFLFSVITFPASFLRLLIF
jgi:hypothetical protein